MVQQGAPPYYFMVPRSISPSAEQLAKLNSIEEVTFVGYPAGLFDRVNFLPIVRRGHAATPLAVDYNGLPAFLIDASVFPGSSGSPVFLVNEGGFMNSGGLTLGSRLYLLGVLAAVHERPRLGSIVELPASHVAVIQENLHLGIVFKSRSIDECIEIAVAGGMAA
jgi:hypothetical protein